MHRFYPDPDRSRDDLEFLTPEDSRHALTVLRLKAGDQVTVISGGLPFLAEIVGEEDRIVCVRKHTPLPSAEPKLSVTLFQGIPKADKMDWIVQKATELGAVRIIPVAFSRCVVRLNEKEGAKKQERWQKIAREAGKQSGRCVIPEVFAPVPFKALQDLFPSCGCVAVPWEDCSEGGPIAFHRRHPNLSSAGIVIGPEGGISPDEIREMSGWGAEPVTLGKRILRTETAGLAALSVFFGLYGEME